ncbi:MULTISPECIES: hypothetical protein [unclassified Streptomyces]|uniref:hypothetical protein n=1 Tax=unclassified Streptomyces TaxID=2593676 RepID=UPI002DDAB56B|nr:hypothetical protein [Streptomyces sp. NBC_01788]WSB28742.1 hypothetical protein OIE49_24170 [Streptomyces sp. NBC_01788]
MKFWRNKKKQPTSSEDAAVAVRLVESWFRSMDPSVAADLTRRWQQSGRLDPDEARRFAAWYRESVRLYMRDATANDRPSTPNMSTQDFETFRAGTLSVAEDFFAFGRWLKAEGYE